MLLVAVVLLAGCKVDARVDVTLQPDGSGTVTARIALDADAVQRLTLRAPLAKAVPLDDVRAAGWEVSEWKPVPGGGQVITLSLDFVGEADLARRLTDLTGATGILRDAKLTRTRDWFGAKDGVEVAVDLRELSTEVRSDPEVVKRLTAAGVDVNALDAQLRSQLGKAFTLTVAVHAPDGRTNTVELTAGGHGTAAASSKRFYTSRVAFFTIGAVLLVVALLLMGASMAATMRRRRAS